MSSQISLEDRFGIYDVLGAYVWALDTGDVEGVVNVFTPDGRAMDTGGNVFEGSDGIRDFVTKFTSRPEFKGRQHYVEHLKIEPADGGGWKVTSYWTVLQWHADTGVREIFVNGYSHDTCVKLDGRWLIKERLLYYWNSEQLPWKGA